MASLLQRFCCMSILLLVSAAMTGCAEPATAVASQSTASADTAAPSIPVKPVTDASPIAETAVTQFLQGVYGPNAALSGRWSGEPLDATLKPSAPQAGGEREVCARKAVTVAGQPTVLLAVCGAPDSPGHVSAANTDFFLLRSENGKLVATAQKHFESFGSIGAVSSVEVERFGADLYGFIVEGGFSNQGYNAGARNIVLPHNATFVDAGWLRSEMDNDLAMENCRERGDCGPNAAYNIGFDLHIDDSTPHAAAYPLRIKETGQACGKPAQADYTLTLDMRTMRYDIPKALQRDDCVFDADMPSA